MITNDDDDDDDKLPARHHAIIKWLVSDFYREWSLYKKIIIKDKKFWQIWVDLMIHPDTSINQFLSGFIFSLLWCWDLESDRSKEGYLSALG